MAVREPDEVARVSDACVAALSPPLPRMGEEVGVQTEYIGNRIQRVARQVSLLSS